MVLLEPYLENNSFRVFSGTALLSVMMEHRIASKDS